MSPAPLVGEGAGEGGTSPCATLLIHPTHVRQALQKGGNLPLWQRGAGGDFQKICVFNYGLLSMY